MSRERFLVVVGPAVVIGTVEALSDTLLDPVLPFPADAIVVTLTVLLLSAILAAVAFRRIDALQGTVAARNRALERRAASASALRRVSLSITALADLHQILDAIVDNARLLLGTDVAVLLLQDDAGRLRHAASSGPPEAIDPSGERDPGATGGEVDEVRRFVGSRDLASRLDAPIQRGGGTIGLLVVGARGGRSFDVDDMETLASLATQSAIAIENARLQSRLRELAVETERERIAREMHDGLAQVLGYVRTKSQAVRELLAADRASEARIQLDELDAAARSIYVDVREAILGLRSPIRSELGLVGAIEEYAVRFGEATKLAVAVQVEPSARAVDLDPETQAQIFRIVQESLTNARKHAAAERVLIAIALTDDTFHVELADNGRGIDLDRSGPDDWPHDGLRAMRERAASIGGRIAFGSGPRGGGVVDLRVPIGPSAVPVTAGAAAS